MVDVCFKKLRALRALRALATLRALRALRALATPEQSLLALLDYGEKRLKLRA